MLEMRLCDRGMLRQRPSEWEKVVATRAPSPSCEGCTSSTGEKDSVMYLLFLASRVHGILVSQPGIKLVPPAVEVLSLNLLNHQRSPRRIVKIRE